MPRRMCSTPAMKVDDTAPSPTSSTPSLPSAGSMLGPFVETKCLGSSAMPFSRARSSSRSCHCAGIRPVFAQCWTVLWLRDSSRASADCPPNRSITCSAGFCCVFMPAMLPKFPVAGQGHPGSRTCAARTWDLGGEAVVTRPDCPECPGASPGCIEGPARHSLWVGPLRRYPRVSLRPRF